MSERLVRAGLPLQPSASEWRTRSASARRVTFMVHMIPRFVTDFGALATHLASHGIGTTIFASRSPRESSAGWARPDIAERYRSAIPAAIGLAELPIDRESIGPLALLRTMLASFVLGLRSPRALFVLWTALPIVVCGLPLRLLRRRCVFLLTGLGTIFGSNALRYRVVRPVVARLYVYLFSARRSRVIVHNHDDADFLVQRGLARDHVIVTPGCGVDPAEFPFNAKLPENRRKIVLVPVRLLREKGVLDAARASALLRAQGIDHEMWFSCSVDPGNPSSLTAEEIQRLEREIPSVRFIGYQPSLVPLYATSDVVCIPTCYREGLPTALLEAAASGRPIVATDNVGCREFVTAGQTALSVPCGSPNALAAALARIIEDDALAERLRLAAYDRFRAGFTKAHMVAITIDVMRELGLEIAPTFSKATEPLVPGVAARVTST